MVKTFLLALGLLVAAAPTSQAAFSKPAVEVKASLPVTTVVEAESLPVVAPYVGTTNTRLSARQERRQARKMVWNAFKNGLRRTPGSGGKSQIVAAVLCFFLGSLGIHRFYLGYTTIGILQLLAFILFPVVVLGVVVAAAVTTGSLGFTLILAYLAAFALLAWILVDFVRILLGTLQPKNGSYSTTL